MGAGELFRYHVTSHSKRIRFGLWYDSGYVVRRLILESCDGRTSLTGDVLGEGSFGKVMTGINNFTGEEVAVKRISKTNSWFFSRDKVLREVELYYLCRGVPEIVQLLEYFEEEDAFYLIFEKAQGGPLFSYLQSKEPLSENQARSIIKDLSKALSFLHKNGIAHRDLKPENVLCINKGSPTPVKLCDFDLCSSVIPSVSTPRLTSPVGSAEYMAPEVVNAFIYSSLDEYEYYEEYMDDDELYYDKNCDLWSLGVLTYILITGIMPFRGSCNDDMCDWDSGGECAECQRTLFHAIKSGNLRFPENKPISKEAKDLIMSLLNKEPRKRPTTEQIATHPWVLGISTTTTTVHNKKSFFLGMKRTQTSSMLYPEDDNHKSKL
ncbi:MKNK [Lepeophtheirus salmonis]|uniref:MKNK n=1 Tax=Lepeophtheirus salmonis TaxID=72036 RepID=A0A7R8CE80_LEPSM|nr:MKNK [Lepeophtheirus salmonis]CAF2793029.1 MKNK [Lepeophtheirus salmonis]